MNVLERLTLDSATALLNCLQYSYLKSDHASDYLTAKVLAAALCDVLSQLEKDFPGVVEEYGWIANGTPLPAETEQVSVLAMDLYR